MARLSGTVVYEEMLGWVFALLQYQRRYFGFGPRDEGKFDIGIHQLLIAKVGCLGVLLRGKLKSFLILVFKSVIIRITM